MNLDEFGFAIQFAISQAPKVWTRINKSSDLPHEACRAPGEGEPEVVVMAACLREQDIEYMRLECQAHLQAKAAARAALDFIQKPDRAMVEAGAAAIRQHQFGRPPEDELDAVRVYERMIAALRQSLL